MRFIAELSRRQAPANLPQSLCWDGERLWMGSLATKKLYAIDPNTWTVHWQIDAPGSPFGLTAVASSSASAAGFELRVLCGETAEDYRFVRRCIPYDGFDTVFKIPCPDDTGSQLGYDGQRLHISQWYKQVVLQIDDDGKVLRSTPAPRGICGQVIVDGVYCLITTADEETDDYFLTRIDPAKPDQPEDLARIPFPARALAYDGERFWTNHRAAHEIVSFSAG